MWLAVEGSLATSGNRHKQWARATYKYLYNLVASPLAGKFRISLVPHLI